jgi:hypothetical protein
MNIKEEIQHKQIVIVYLQCQIEKEREEIRALKKSSLNNRLHVVAINGHRLDEIWE